MLLLALGFVAAAALQIGGLAVLATVGRDLVRSLGRVQVGRLLDAQQRQVDRERVVLGAGLFTGGIVAMGACGAALAMAAG